MATSDIADALHNPAGIDWLDYIAAPFFAIATFVTMLEATVSMTLFSTTFSLADVPYTMGSLDLSWAFIITMVTLVVAALTNELGDYDEDWHRAVPVAAVVLNVAMIAPAFSDLITGSDLVGIVGVMVNAAAFALIAYY